MRAAISDDFVIAYRLAHYMHAVPGKAKAPARRSISVIHGYLAQKLKTYELHLIRSKSRKATSLIVVRGSHTCGLGKSMEIRAGLLSHHDHLPAVLSGDFAFFGTVCLLPDKFQRLLLFGSGFKPQ
jgi:hypothetical protein